ncbi:protein NONRESPONDING TO OXYLIPINS 2, mitochondrial-like [Miscanthus floridulus]|uniref:protein NONRESPONDING TO OXYLIPINS 2, mitochondrial-like n=1 Tax=Miscanthus floridulus TaxID=154761 RepID=UPI00345ACC5A
MRFCFDTDARRQGGEEMASLSRTTAAAAAAVAVRSAARSAPLTSRVLSAPLPSLASPSAARSAGILRRSAAAASAGLETLMPLHSAVAAARLRSCIAVDSSCWCSLSQGYALPL